MAQNHGKYIKQGRWWNIHGIASTDLVLQWESMRLNENVSQIFMISGIWEIFILISKTKTTNPKAKTKITNSYLNLTLIS